MTSDTVISYFNHKLETELVVDALPHGVGVILTQIQPTKDGRRDVQIVACASHALDNVESRYSQTEREALAVRWGVEHFHLYLYGIKFTVVTDHKTLVSKLFVFIIIAQGIRDVGVNTEISCKYRSNLSNNY